VKFAHARSINSKSSEIKASASNITKAVNKAPQKVTLVLPTIPKKKLAHNKPAEISEGSDDEEFESPAPVLCSH
jgi:hypothetical protein